MLLCPPLDLLHVGLKRAGKRMEWLVLAVNNERSHRFGIDGVDPHRINPVSSGLTSH